MKKIFSTFKNSDPEAGLPGGASPARRSLGGVGAESGFTLVELMVSLALFIIVVFALIGSLYTVNDASRRVQAMRTVMDNLNFATESMSRTIRTGTNISCGIGTTQTNCTIANGVGSTGLSLDGTLGEYKHIEYEKVIENGRGVIKVKKDNGSFVAITAPEINIEQFAFYVDGAQPSDGIQPSVIIKIEGVANIPNGTIVPFALQTYLSQRTPEARP